MVWKKLKTKLEYLMPKHICTITNLICHQRQTVQNVVGSPRKKPKLHNIAIYIYNWLNDCISDSDNSYLNHCMRALNDMLQRWIDGWSSCNFKGALYRPPWTLSKQMFRGGRQVFHMGHAPSGPTVIRPLEVITHFFLSSRSVRYGHVFESSSFFSISSTVSVFTCQPQTSHIPPLHTSDVNPCPCP